MAYDIEIAQRVRDLFAGRSDVVEKRMVGGLSFVVNGNMCCGVTGSDLMVRVGKDGRADALAQPHVRPMKLGGSDVTGFVRVEPDGFSTTDALAAWVGRGLAFVATLPPKPTSSPKERQS